MADCNHMFASFGPNDLCANGCGTRLADAWQVPAPPVPAIPVEPAPDPALPTMGRIVWVRPGDGNEYPGIVLHVSGDPGGIILVQPFGIEGWRAMEAIHSEETIEGLVTWRWPDRP